jgi:hypothetical protein
VTAACYVLARLAVLGRRLRDTVRRGLPAPHGFDPRALPPPSWIARPDWPSDSIGWRMGGEAHFLLARERYAALTPSGQAAHERAFPVPPGWEGYVDSGRKGWRVFG